MIDFDLHHLPPERPAPNLPSDGATRDAFAAVRAAARRALRENAFDWTDMALTGLARAEAEGALLDLDLDPEDVPPGLLAALAAEFFEVYRAC